MATQDDYIKTALRLPRGIHVKVQQSAEAKGRSMNAEIIDRLSQSLDRDILAEPVARDFGPVTAAFLPQLAGVLKELERADKELEASSTPMKVALSIEITPSSYREESGNPKLNPGPKPVATGRSNEGLSTYGGRKRQPSLKGSADPSDDATVHVKTAKK